MSTAAAPDALRRKLGVGPGMTVAAVGAPEGVLPLAGLPEGTTVVREMVEPATASVVVGFTTYRAELVSVLARLLFLVEPGGSLWVAWPKRTSKVPTDLSDQVRPRRRAAARVGRHEGVCHRRRVGGAPIRRPPSGPTGPDARRSVTPDQASAADVRCPLRA